MFRCTNCGKIYADETALCKIVETKEKDKDGVWHTIDRRVLLENEYTPEITDKLHEEIFKGCGDCCFDESLENITKNSKDFTDGQIEQIWDIFSNIPFEYDEDDDIVLDCDWFGFLKGTSRDDIWRWFDENHSKGVYYLLYELYQDE